MLVRWNANWNWLEMFYICSTQKGVLCFVGIFFIYFNLSENKHSQCIFGLGFLEILKSQRELYDFDADQI